MERIIRLNKNFVDRLSNIDLESGHNNDKEEGISEKSMKKSIKKRLNSNEIFFGYEENRELKGYVTLKPFFPGHLHCEIFWLAVKKKYQGKGIGTMLVKFIEEYAKKKGFRAAFVYTNKNMKTARNFYEKLGYKFINEFHGYYGYKNKNNNTAVLYGKRF